jgi:hypothetical protein
LTVPDYWLPRPPLEADEATEEAVDAFLAGDLDLDSLPRAVMPWQFLCALAARRQIAFHGTGDPGIERFEPREPVDFAPFGQQRAVFATSDPIWAMFYAIVDRAGHELTLNNGCLVLDDLGESYYYFSVSRQALGRQPWRTGYLYLLPADTFVEQPGATYARTAAREPGRGRGARAPARRAARLSVPRPDRGSRRPPACRVRPGGDVGRSLAGLADSRRVVALLEGQSAHDRPGRRRGLVLGGVRPI